MKKIAYILILFLVGFLPACESLDVLPPNIIKNEDIYSESGIKAYMAGLYSRLPMDDFNCTDEGNQAGYFYFNSIKWTMLSTGETVNRNHTDIYLPQKGYWSEGYYIIRNANYLIDNLIGKIGTMNGAEEAIAEAKFIRAYTYFTMVKRYGGVPILEHAQDLEEDLSKLWAPRNSHQECYDFILQDLDYAHKYLSGNKVKGRANKFVAAAVKSRVALFAGTIAKYGGNNSHTVDGVILCGIPVAKANDYFKISWEASKEVEAGNYKLYEKDSNRESNFSKIFTDADNSDESIFVRQYDFNNYVHSFDVIYSTPRMTSTYGDRFNITLDWVELFEGLPIDPTTGRLKTTDMNDEYIVYDGPDGIYKNAEPRLRGSILIPGNTYKTVELDIRRGIINESINPSTKIKKFIPDDGNSVTAYASVPFFLTNVHVTTQNVLQQTPLVLSNGTKLNINGQDGPANGGSQNTLTGFHGRKWLNLNLTPSETKLNASYQTWIDIRYAEILLNRAEAALELFQSGVATYEGVNMQDDAFDCINKIRVRAGATPLASAADLSTAAAHKRGQGIGGFVMAPNRGLQLVRVERYKELAFEHKLYWDLLRWFTFDQQIYNYRRRMLNPFLFADGATIVNGYPRGKYIYDTRVCERANNSLTFQPKFYYERIPATQIGRNPLLQPNINQ